MKIDDSDLIVTTFSFVPDCQVMHIPTKEYVICGEHKTRARNISAAKKMLAERLKAYILAGPSVMIERIGNEQEN